MHTFPVFHILALVDRNNITKSHPQVLPDNLVHPNLGLLTGFVRKDNANSIFPLLALEEDGVAAEEGGRRGILRDDVALGEGVAVLLAGDGHGQPALLESRLRVVERLAGPVPHLDRLAAPAEDEVDARAGLDGGAGLR